MKIIDNFLPEEQFKAIQKVALGSDFGWFYRPTVAFVDEPIGDYFYFTHCLYEDYIAHQMFSLIAPIIEKLNPKAVVRARFNMYPRTDKIYQHAFHNDAEYHHNAAIIYMNTNNGKTIFESGEEVDSIANRLISFDGHAIHASTTCTDEQVRVNMSMNYF